MRFSYLAAIAAIGLAGCEQTPTVIRDDISGLTQAYAEFRAVQVQNVSYQLSVTLDPSQTKFSGENTIAFELTENSSDLTIDFADGDVSAVLANGKTVGVDYNGYFITVPAAALSAGANEVRVSFAHAWSDTGSGLYRYDDPDDGKVYLYSDFEPYDANSAFPLFDQPDIKGRFSLVVTAPEDWLVVSTSRETSIQTNTDATRTWDFPPTLPVPTYVVSLHAGPYVVWEDHDFRIPMRLFARQSMADPVEADVDTWFDISRKGLDFFEDYYGVDYPFGKLDQLLVPDFNSDAMENAAAITYTERTHIQRDGWSYKEKKWHIEVILHEMAHQWFGDLVTMKWWDGLWLNETFAEFMGYQAAADKFGIDDAWQGFFLDRKYVAYWTDQRTTTHPVEPQVADTDSVSANFDMISYAKGASVLRQIEYRLGEDTFEQAIKTYLKRHAMGNTELDDFIAALSEASNTDLNQWAHEWLFTAGANTIEAQYECSEGRVTTFSLAQTAPAEYPILRTQKIQVGFFRDVDGVVVTDAVLPVTYSGASTSIPEAEGKPCPDLVYPNYEDYGYLLVKLDARTRKNLAPMIGRIEDPFQRVMFWQTLWDNVRFAQTPVTEYLEAVLTSAAMEDDLNNVDQIYGFVSSAIVYLRGMHEKGEAALEKYREDIEELTWANINRTRDDVQTMYLDRFLAFAYGNASLERMVGILDGKLKISGREVDQDRRWTMLRNLSREGHERVDELLAIEMQRDPTDDGRRKVIGIEAIRPDIAVKRAIIADVQNVESENSYAIQRIAMRAAFPAGQEQLREELAGEIISLIVQNSKDADPTFAQRARGFATSLVPRNCTHASVERLAKLVVDLEAASPSVLRGMIEKHEDDALCVERTALLP